MPSRRLGIISDVHYAGAAERGRGNDYELRVIPNPGLRFLVKCYRHFFWQRRPLDQSYLLARFLEEAPEIDCLVGNGDYSCNSAFIGVSDDASCESVRECIANLRGKYGANILLTCGDHELGKKSFFGGAGGMRLESWRRMREELGLEPFWRVEIGRYVLIGIASSLVALPGFEADTLPNERPEWERLRAEHLEEIRQALGGLSRSQRVILFCHDPTALPFLWREESVRAALPQFEQTVIGHLHSNLILWESRVLAGMPHIQFMGHTAKKLSAALREAAHWRPFKVRLCPALAGIELLKDGGYYTVELDLDAALRPRWRRHRLVR